MINWYIYILGCLHWHWLFTYKFSILVQLCDSEGQSSQDGSRLSGLQWSRVSLIVSALAVSSLESWPLHLSGAGWHGSANTGATTRATKNPCRIDKSYSSHTLPSHRHLEFGPHYFRSLRHDKNHRSDENASSRRLPDVSDAWVTRDTSLTPGPRQEILPPHNHSPAQIQDEHCWQLFVHLYNQPVNLYRTSWHFSITRRKSEYLV